MDVQAQEREEVTDHIAGIVVAAGQVHDKETELNLLRREYRELIRAAAREGVPLVRIAEAIGCTRQRIHQIVAYAGE